MIDCHANANAFARNDGAWWIATRILADFLAMKSFWIAIPCPKRQNLQWGIKACQSACYFHYFWLLLSFYQLHITSYHITSLLHWLLAILLLAISCDFLKKIAKILWKHIRYFCGFYFLQVHILGCILPLDFARFCRILTIFVDKSFEKKTSYFLPKCA